MRSNSKFVKVSGVALIIIAVIMVGVSTGFNHSALAQSGTMSSTMSGGMMGTAHAPFPPCPPSMSATMSADMSGTMMAGMSATMSAGMSATMAGTMGAGMMGMEPTMSATMAGTMQAMMMSGCQLYAALAGQDEVPSASAGGTGVAVVSISAPASGMGQVCYAIQVFGLKLPATAAHIHKGAAGVAGPVVVPLLPAPDASGVSQGCTQNVDPAILADILTNPGNYYVNVHTSDFPNGAARGQLETSDMGMMSK